MDAKKYFLKSVMIWHYKYNLIKYVLQLQKSDKHLQTFFQMHTQVRRQSFLSQPINPALGQFNAYWTPTQTLMIIY